MTTTEANTTEHTVTARADHRCEGYRCIRTIRQGGEYVRAVAFPGHDVNGGTTPWVLRICVECWRAHDSKRALPPKMVSKR